MMIRLLISAVAFAALAACSSDPMRDIRDLFHPAKGQAAFTTGLKQYENGDYAEAAKNLHSALANGLRDGDKGAAHQHLSFVSRLPSRKPQPRNAVRQPLA